MNEREQFEAQYISKHFETALKNKEFTFRELKKWMQDEWLGNKYNDAEIQIAWLEWQLEQHKHDAARYRWIKNNIKEVLVESDIEHKTVYELPNLTAWANFCGAISLDEAIDMKIEKERAGAET